MRDVWIQKKDNKLQFCSGLSVTEKCNWIVPAFWCWRTSVKQKWIFYFSWYRPAASLLSIFLKVIWRLLNYIWLPLKGLELGIFEELWQHGSFLCSQLSVLKGIPYRPEGFICAGEIGRYFEEVTVFYIFFITGKPLHLLKLWCR